MSDEREWRIRRVHGSWPFRYAVDPPDRRSHALKITLRGARRSSAQSIIYREPE